MSKENFDKENFEKILASRKNVVKFSDGEIYLWVEQGSCVMLKAITQYGDPVELFSEEVRELGETLIKMAAQIE